MFQIRSEAPKPPTPARLSPSHSQPNPSCPDLSSTTLCSVWLPRRQRVLIAPSPDFEVHRTCFSEKRSRLRRNSAFTAADGMPEVSSSSTTRESRRARSFENCSMKRPTRSCASAGADAAPLPLELDFLLPLLCPRRPPHSASMNC